MQKYPEMKIRVEAHTDNRGPSSYNLKHYLKIELNQQLSMLFQKVSMKIESQDWNGENEPMIECSGNCSNEDHKNK